MAASENRFTPELNEKEVIELLEDLSNILGAFLIKQFFHLHLLFFFLTIINRLTNLQYNTATHTIYSTTPAAYTTYNTIQFNTYTTTIRYYYCYYFCWVPRLLLLQYYNTL